MPLFASDLTVSGSRLKPPVFASTGAFPTASTSEGTVVYESTNNVAYLSDGSAWLKFLTGSGANQQVGVFSSGSNIAGNVNLLFTGTQLGVGGTPTATIHAVGGFIRADGVLYSRGAGSPTGSSGASSLRLENTVAANTWYLSNINSGEFELRNDSVANVFGIDVGGRAYLGATASDLSAILRLDAVDMGFLPPRMTTTQRNAIASPATGLLLYNTTTNALTVRLASSWLELGGGGGTPGGSNTHVQFNNAGAFGGVANFAWDNTNSRLSLGAPSGLDAVFNIKGATTGSGFLIKGQSSANTLRFYAKDDGEVGLYHLINAAGSSQSIDVESPLDVNLATSYTTTSGIVTLNQYRATFAPTSGTADFNLITIAPTINQTGGASGVTRGVYFNPTVTAAANLRIIETTAGNVLFGNGTSPGTGVRLGVFGIGTSSSTHSFAAFDGSGSAVFAVRDDGKIGIKTTNPTYTMDFTSSTDGIRVPSGTTAQRPAGTPAAVLRYNSTDNLLEYGTGSAWIQLSSGGGGGGTPGGSSGQVQFNNAGAFGGSSQLYWDSANTRLGLNISAPDSVVQINTSTGLTPAAVEQSLLQTWDFALVGDSNQPISGMYQASTTNRPVYQYVRSRGTVGAPAIIVSGDRLGSFVASGYDGSAFQSVASIEFDTDGTVSSGSVPGRIGFWTGTSGANRAERLSIGSAGNVTLTNEVSATSTTTDRLIIKTNSTGTPAGNFGTAMLFQGESTTTVDRDMVRLAAVWVTATDASRESALSFQNVFSGSGLTERFRIGSSAITLSQAYTIGNSGSALTLGGSSGAVTVTTTSSSGITLSATSSVNPGIVVGPATWTAISKAEMRFRSGVTASSGTLAYNQLEFFGTHNVTGTTTGTIKAININPTLTSLTGTTYYGIDMPFSNVNAIGINQSGANTRNVFEGPTRFGLVDVTGTTQSVVNNSRYKANHASTRIVFTLPTTAAVGDEVQVVGYGAAGWRLGQNASQQIVSSTGSTTTGTGGYIQSNNRYDGVTLTCVVANTTWVISRSAGTLTFV